MSSFTRCQTESFAPLRPRWPQRKKISRDQARLTLENLFYFLIFTARCGPDASPTALLLFLLNTVPLPAKR